MKPALDVSRLARVLTVACFCLAVLGGPSRAQTPIGPVQPPGNPAPAPPPRGRGQFAQIRERFKSQREALRQQIDQKREELGNLIAANASAQQSHAKLLEIVQLEGQLEDVNLQEYYAIIDLLPPDKRKIYTDRMSEQVRRRHGSPAPGATPQMASPQP